MHNFYYIIIAFSTLVKIFASSLSVLKIENTFSLINEQLVADSIDEKSKIDVISKDNMRFLEIDQERLKDLVESTIKSNLQFVKYEIKYYFYDYVTKEEASIYEFCNSVQFKVTIEYQGKKYEELFRYEPMEIQ